MGWYSTVLVLIFNPKTENWFKEFTFPVDVLPNSILVFLGGFPGQYQLVKRPRHHRFLVQASALDEALVTIYASLI